jgi:hypothetical protein
MTCSQRGRGALWSMVEARHPPRHHRRLSGQVLRHARTSALEPRIYLNSLNRRMRTRMSGDVAGASGQPLPRFRLVRER